MKVKSLSRVQLFATPWTAAYQAPPSMGFSRQDYSMDMSLGTLLELVMGREVWRAVVRKESDMTETALTELIYNVVPISAIHQ